jgi:hypothetical protein
MRRGLEHATRDTRITRSSQHATVDGDPASLTMGNQAIEALALCVPVSAVSDHAPGERGH